MLQLHPLNATLPSMHDLELNAFFSSCHLPPPAVLPGGDGVMGVSVESYSSLTGACRLPRVVAPCRTWLRP